MIRPAVANVDQAVVVFSAGHPRANLNLLDRFLVLMKSQGVPVIICFNKTDTATEEDLQLFQETYKNCGSPLLFVSAGTGEGLNKLQRLLEGKTSVFAGSSGVGKSSLINALSPRMALETGEISHKIKRGKHTTRHTSLLYLYKATYVLDTPGFSSLYLTGITPEQVRDSYLDFLPFISSCRFLGCVHIGEQACGVKEAVQHGLISPVRYRNYTLIYEEQKNSLNTYR